MVSSETFDPSVKSAADWVGPNYDSRRETIDATAAKKDKGRSS